jgi:RNA polymerase sigma-70 factor (ECF subfamily)
MTEFQFHQKILGLQGVMYDFAMLLTSKKEDAEDLMQETALRILDNRDKYVDNNNFKGWVLTVMRNIFINSYRKMVYQKTFVDETEDSYLLNLPQNSGMDNPECSLTVKEIEGCINNLNDDMRMPFLLHTAGYKYDEISEKMGLPLGTVKSRIFNARKELQLNLNYLRN